MPADDARALGPGGAALVGLTREANLGAIGRASRQLRRGAPEAQQADLLAILQVLSTARARAPGKAEPPQVTVR
jgi:hypothetical protein